MIVLIDFWQNKELLNGSCLIEKKAGKTYIKGELVSSPSIDSNK